MSCFDHEGLRMRFAGCKRLVTCNLILFFSFLFSTPSYAGDSNGYRPFTDIEQYEYALFLMEKGDYLHSAREFGRLIELFPSSLLIEDAQYNMGLSYLKGRMFKEASEQFRLYLQNFPQGTYFNEAMIKKEIASTRMNGGPATTPPSTPRPKGSLYPSPSFLAIQVHTLNGRNYKEVEEEIRYLKDKGYDVLILRVFHNRGDRFYPFVKPRVSSGVYFETSSSPVVEDILTPILKITKRYNIKVFAWMTTRYADYGLEEREDLRCKSYDFEKNNISYCKGLDLFNEDAVRHLEGLYRDLAKYPIDGILFQDDLILRHNEGFGKYASVLFNKDMNLPLDPARLYTYKGNGRYSVEYTEEFWKWAAWKNKHLLSVARRLMVAVREVNPEVSFAINMMYESAYKPTQALAWLSQSLEGAAKVGFDFYAIMAYHRQIQKELNIDFTRTLDVLSNILEYAAEKVEDPQKVLLKFQLVDWDTSQEVPVEEIEDVIKLVSYKRVNIALSPYKRSFPLDRASALIKVRSEK